MGVATALKKLKTGKNSPDGFTAEIMHSLPLEQRAKLSDDMRRRLHNLDVPGEWFECTADSGSGHSCNVQINSWFEHHEEDCRLHVPVLASTDGVQDTSNDIK